MAKARPTRRSNLAGDQARERILAAAIAMFSKHGYAATATRDITAEAGVNQAAIHYHFGGKRELFLAAITKHFVAIEKERFKLLDVAESRTPVCLEEVLTAFVQPHIRFAATRAGRQYLQLYNHFASTPEDIIVELYARHFSTVRERFLAAIRRCLPEISDEALIRAFSFISNNIVSSLFDARYEVATGRKPYSIKVDEFVALLVAYHAAGLRAIA